jgi:hypothetical protein
VKLTVAELPAAIGPLFPSVAVGVTFAALTVNVVVFETPCAASTAVMVTV